MAKRNIRCNHEIVNIGTAFGLEPEHPHPLGRFNGFAQGAFAPELGTESAKTISIHLGQSVGAAAVHDVYADAVNACTEEGYRHVEFAGLACGQPEPEPQQPLQPPDVYANAVNARTGAGYRYVELAGLAAGTQLEPEPQQPPQQFDVSLFKRLKDTTPKPRSYTWARLCDILSTPKIRHKKDGLLISGATFTGQRSNAAVDSVSMLSLDYDHAANMEHALEVWRGFQFAAYTSFSHGTPEKPCAFRVIIPLAEPIPNDQYPALWAWADEISGGAIDPICKDLSRAMYLPACPPDRRHLFRFVQGEGRALDWKSLNLAKYQQSDADAVVSGPITPEVQAWVKGAVASIDPACDYETWRNVGFILFDTLGADGFDVWEEWTKPRSKTRNDRLRPTWRNFEGRTNIKRRVGLGTLAKLARDAGFPDACPHKSMKLADWRGCMVAINEYGSNALPAVSEFIGQKYNPIEQTKRFTDAWFQLGRSLGYPELSKKMKSALKHLEKCRGKSAKIAEKSKQGEFEALIALHAEDQALEALGKAENAITPVIKELEAARKEIRGPLKAQALAAFTSYMKEITGHIELTGPNVEVINEPLLPALDVADGDTLCVQSDLGTGKTHQLAALIAKMEAESLPGLPLRVVLIGPRISLIKQSAKRCGLADYEATKAERAEGSKDWKISTYKLAVTVNSLAGLIDANKAYDLVAIDESELLAGHLVGKTIDDKDGTLEHFYSFMGNAKRVLCLDAFTGNSTLHMLKQAGRSNIRVLRNVHQAWENHPVDWYTDKEALTTELHNALNSGKKCFVATNGAGHAEKLYEGLNERFPKLRALLVTRETSKEPAQMAFMANPNDEALNYDFVVASPTIESGLSIDAPRFSETFGYFFSGEGTGTALAAIQSLARNRKAGRWHVWTDNREQCLPADPVAVLAEKAARYEHSLIQTGPYSFTRPEKSFDFSGNPVAMLDAQVTAWGNQQKNSMAKAVYAFLANMGCTITRAVADAVNDRDFGKELAETGNEIRNEKRAAKIMEARKLTDAEEAEIIEKGATLEQSYQLERKTLEREYMTDLDNDPEAAKALILTDKDGTVIGNIKRMEEGLAEPESVLKAARVFHEGKGRHEDGKKHPIDRAHALPFRAKVKRALFAAAGLEVMPDGSAQLPEKPVKWDNRSLKETAWFKLCLDNPELVNASGLGTKLKPGWEKTPAKAFGEMLRACGLETSVKRCEVKLKSDPHPSFILKEKKRGVDQKTKRIFKRVYWLKPIQPRTAYGERAGLMLRAISARAADRNWVDLVWRDKEQAADCEQIPDDPDITAYHKGIIEIGALASWSGGAA
ncbi:MAG: hypothetical protein GY862_37680 [Gammaproteobacteria bacterium]|nr:hypothetical protein [Gammaproteobacteria bacterium]